MSAIQKTAPGPTVGFVREPDERRFTLSFGIADIFKPILADRPVFRLMNRRQTTTDDFETELAGCLFAEQERLTVLEEFERSLDQTVQRPRLMRKVSLKTLVQTSVYSLKKRLLTGEPHRATEKWW